MAMINIMEGTMVFVPWRIQGIVRNEERLLSYSIHLLEKQHRYLLSCITREQMIAANKLERFMEKFNSAPKLSAITKSSDFGRKNKGSAKPWRLRRPQPKHTPCSQQQTFRSIGILPVSARSRYIPHDYLFRTKLYAQD